MKKITEFDVLIVYAETVAKSALSANNDRITPFFVGSKYEPLNTVYGYFLEICKRKKLKAAFTTSADVVGPGECRSYWTYNYKKWSKVSSTAYSKLIFDKFSPVSKTMGRSRKLLFSSKRIRPFNDPWLFKLFFDKQKTYKRLAQYSIPTVSLNNSTVVGIESACRRLSNLSQIHPDAVDFSDQIIMKDRFGAGGRHVYKFGAEEQDEMLTVIKKNSSVSYIIQPYTKFDLGFSYLNRVACTDIRLIYLGGEVVQSYIRVARVGEFRCNEHQGGDLTYLAVSEIPLSVLEKASLIAENLDKKCSLYTLDFIVSNNGNAFFLEGNTGPGLDWNMARKRNEIEAKKLIRMVVEELALKVEEKMVISKKRIEYDSAYTVTHLGI